MKVLLAGASGMLGSAFASRLQSDAYLAQREELDVSNVAGFARLLKDSQPDVVINCAAHVDPESAEIDPDPAYVANALMPGLLATTCRRSGVRLVHFSSTGCYGAWKSTPYSEEDRAEPTTVHHRSKLSGEELVRQSGCEHLILRTGWLFGGGPHHKRNFVWRRLVEATANSVLNSDTEQTGNPTYIGDVVEQTLELVRLGLTGVHNCVSHGAVTRFDYVSRILMASNVNCVVRPSGAFQRMAPVSPNEAAVNYRLGLMGLDRMPLWSVSLDAYVASLRGQPEWLALNTSGAIAG